MQITKIILLVPMRQMPFCNYTHSNTYLYVSRYKWIYSVTRYQPFQSIKRIKRIYECVLMADWVQKVDLSYYAAYLSNGIIIHLWLRNQSKICIHGHIVEFLVDIMKRWADDHWRIPKCIYYFRIAIILS